MLECLSRRAGRVALVMSAALPFASPAAGQFGAPAIPYAGVESPDAALARNLRILAVDPRNFQALNAAGRAALETGDTQAAAGFFGRASEVSPQSWQPQAGMGAAMVVMGDPAGAMVYFTRAQAFGAAHILIALDRGLAFDLLGDQPKAQSDYRAALAGAQADEARRRLALSLAISRDIRGAKAMIDPLLRRGDRQSLRTNAFVLALAGDIDGARWAIDLAMPGAGPRFDPFFRIFPVLRPAEKAAAVHLGIFPKDASQRQASVQPMPSPPVAAIDRPRKMPVAAPPPPVRTVALPGPPSAPRTRAKVSPPARSEPIPQPTFSAIDPSRPPVAQANRAPQQQPEAPAPAFTIPIPAPSAPAVSEAEPEARPADRLSGIDALLGEPGSAADAGEPLVKVAEAQVPEAEGTVEPPPAAKPKVESARPKPASSPAESRAAEKKAKAEADKKAKAAAEKKAKAEAERKARAEAARIGTAGINWVQLAGGANKDRMVAEYRKLAAKAGSLLKSRPGYVTVGKDYFRLLVGPFPTTDKAQEFVRRLDKAGIDSFRWTRSPAQIRIEKLKT